MGKQHQSRRGALKRFLCSARVARSVWCYFGCLALASTSLKADLLPDAQDPSQSWDVTRARGQTRDIDFTTTEGTWMSVDISPNGEWIVFDLLGHIYRVPSEGGDAEALTQNSGVALNLHPAYSPRGDAIAFVSDRGGQLNLWIMDVDGSNPRPVFVDLETRITEPSWTPEGKHILATRHYKTAVGFQRKAAKIWMFPREGGEGIELVGSDASQAYWASPTPDMEYVYYHSETRPEPVSARQRLQHLRRVNLATGRIERTSSSAGNVHYPTYAPVPREIAPEVSPDGRWLTFARRNLSGTISYRDHQYGPRTALWVRNLESGAERILMDPITSDVMDGHRSKNLRVLPGYSWAADSRSIVISQAGKLRRVWLESGRVEIIPFRARVRRTISEMAKAELDVQDGLFDAYFLRWPASSPDGRTLIFEAVGRLWTLDLPDGTPRALLENQEGFEMTPAWSPDGQWIVYTTWSDTERGHVWKVRRNGRDPVRLSSDPGEYLYPEWDTDGQNVIVSSGSGATARGEWWSQNSSYELVRLSPDGSSLGQHITGTGPVAKATPGIDGRIYFPRSGGGGDVQRLIQMGQPVPQPFVELQSVDQKGGDPRRHLTVPSADFIVPSPDRDRIAFQAEGDVYLSPLPRGGGAESVPRIDKDAGGLPVRRLSREGGLYPRWRNAGVLEFVSGNRYFAHDVVAGRTDTVEISLSIARPIARGSIALTGARIVTLTGDEVIESGTVLVRDGRIECVGECNQSGADRVLSMAGKTIVPGFVDVHAHHFLMSPEVVPQHRSESAKYLAYGFTTVLDPSASARLAFPVAQLIEAGKLVGPRTFATGDAMTGWTVQHRQIRTKEDAADNVNRLASWGAVSIKDYIQPRRYQRQWIADAARKRGVTLTAENEDLFYSIGLIMDGHAGFEHPLQYVPLYSDASTFLGQAGATYSPTLIVGGASLWSLEYFLGHDRVWEDPKYRRWTQWRDLTKLQMFVAKPIERYAFPIMAEGVADVWRAGGRAAVGGHGEVIGPGGHWEIWMYAEALEPMEALRLAAQGGASFVGLDDDIGSIAVGKVADLVILNSNPLDDIRNTIDIQSVMKGGRLYDGDTLDEIWPEQKPYGPRWWFSEDHLRTDDRADISGISE